MRIRPLERSRGLLNGNARVMNGDGGRNPNASGPFVDLSCL